MEAVFDFVVPELRLTGKERRTSVCLILFKPNTQRSNRVEKASWQHEKMAMLIFQTADLHIVYRYTMSRGLEQVEEQ